MAKLKIKAKDLRRLGLAKGPPSGIALEILRQHHRHTPPAEALEQLAAVMARPGTYLEDAVWSRLAQLLHTPVTARPANIELAERAIPYRSFGGAAIAEGAHQQMELAMRLPVSTGGALLPDAHRGYGLPIGGVLATENAIIPYAVGLDIGCRMCLSIFAISSQSLDEAPKNYQQLLRDHSRFGRTTFADPYEDEVLARPLYHQIPLLRQLQGKARQQIGSSGSGNHFVEFGSVEITEGAPQLGVAPGHYLGLLSHSGSRGIGAGIAQHYTKIAMQRCPLPTEAKSLAWLDLDSEAGQAYWLAMNLAGDYASACHHHIHRRIAGALGENPIGRVENHHNFAWKEKRVDGREWIVHRKGATPAGRGVLGVIPGSMTAPGFIVRGRGAAESLASASHGAGRAMSRRKAKNTLNRKAVRQQLKKAGVHLIGGGIDEAPQAYKDIHEVMKQQRQLVEVIGRFQPRIVRMDQG